MSSRLIRLTLLAALCSLATGCHTTSIGQQIGYPAPPAKSERWAD
jgi:hypothetical protein